MFRSYYTSYLLYFFSALFPHQCSFWQLLDNLDDLDDLCKGNPRISQAEIDRLLPSSASSAPSAAVRSTPVPNALPAPVETSALIDMEAPKSVSEELYDRVRKGSLFLSRRKGS